MGPRGTAGNSIWAKEAKDGTVEIPRHQVREVMTMEANKLRITRLKHLAIKRKEKYEQRKNKAYGVRLVRLTDISM